MASQLCVFVGGSLIFPILAVASIYIVTTSGFPSMDGAGIIVWITLGYLASIISTHRISRWRRWVRILIWSLSVLFHSWLIFAILRFFDWHAGTLFLAIAELISLTICLTGLGSAIANRTTEQASDQLPEQ